MNKRDYFSIRTGKIKPNEIINLKVLKKLFSTIYLKLGKDGFFQKHFGYYCVDQGEVAGELGYDLKDIMFIHLKGVLPQGPK